MLVVSACLVAVILTVALIALRETVRVRDELFEEKRSLESRLVSYYNEKGLLVRAFCEQHGKRAVTASYDNGRLTAIIDCVDKDDENTMTSYAVNVRGELEFIVTVSLNSTSAKFMEGSSFRMMTCSEDRYGRCAREYFVCDSSQPVVVCKPLD